MLNKYPLEDRPKCLSSLIYPPNKNRSSYYRETKKDEGDDVLVESYDGRIWREPNPR